MSALRLLRVALGSGGTTLWLAGLGLVTTPLLIRKLGVDAYGVFALITLIVAYLSNVEFGFGTAMIRFLARARAEGDASAQSRVLGVSLVVFSIAGVVAGGGLILGAPMVVDTFLHVPASLEVPTTRAVRIAGLILLLTLLLIFVSGALQAYECFAPMLRRRALFGTLLSVTTVSVVLAGGSVDGALAAQAVVMTAAFVANWKLFRRVSRGFSFRPHAPTFRTMGRFAIPVFFAGAAFQLLLNGPPAVLAAATSTAEVASYSVPSVVLQQISLVIGAGSLASVNLASEAIDSARLVRLREVFASHLRFKLMMMAGTVAPLGVFGEQIFSVWISDSFAAAAVEPLRILCAAAVVLGLSAPAADVARGLGRPTWIAGFTATAAATAILTASLTVEEGGAVGASLALLVGVSTPILPLLVGVCVQLLGFTPGEAVRILAKPVLAVGAILLALLSADIIGKQLPDSVGGGVTGVLACAALAAYVAGIYVFVLTSEERRAVSQLIASARSIRGNG